jgi:arsenate reductase
MILYGLAHCSTTQKALRQLQQQGIQATLIDVRAHPWSLNELRALSQRTTQPLRAWLNTSGQAYRTLKATLQDADDEALLQAMVHEPMLIKRPLLVSPTTVMAGYHLTRYQALND